MSEIFRDNTPLVHIYHPSVKERTIVPLLEFYLDNDIIIYFILYDENMDASDLTNATFNCYVKQHYWDEEYTKTYASGSGIDIIRNFEI